MKNKFSLRNAGTLLSLGGSIALAACGGGDEPLGTGSTPGNGANDTVLFSAIAAGHFYGCGILTTGETFCWGKNTLGALGAGSQATADTSLRNLPLQIASDVAMVSVSAGEAHTCSIDPAGEAFCWGSNGLGQLASPVLPCLFFAGCSDVPIKVTGGLKFTWIAPGQLHTCALTPEGEAFCWGVNRSGELGVGAAGPDLCLGTVCNATPAAVVGGLVFTSITAGSAHTCALAADSMAYCWGFNQVGQLGIGSAVADECGITRSPCSNVPLAVSGGLKFSALEAGGLSTCGITNDGRTMCWGNDGLRDSSEVVSVPVEVAGGVAFTSLSVGSGWACGINSASDVYCWGTSPATLGDGTTRNQSATPVLVAGQLKFASVSVGLPHACGVTTGSAAYCWGDNASGALGWGGIGIATVPVMVEVGR